MANRKYQEAQKRVDTLFQHRSKVRQIAKMMLVSDNYKSFVYSVAHIGESPASIHGRNLLLYADRSVVQWEQITA